MARSKTQMTAEAAARIQASQSKSGKDNGFAARAKAAASRNARAAQNNSSEGQRSGRSQPGNGHNQHRSS
ncbi:putative SMP domain-containing protein [Seiridium cardinale]|uniref:SMP domain-containing protein n=1 Tax=Seiridium cardinale TaxID=138064 RepID=A0ABR2XZM2_9PEZI